VFLRIAENGDIMVSKADRQPDELTRNWPSLFMALEAHFDDVVALVEAGWTVKAGFPKDTAA
jgi:hypothetical protein